jgi:membrane-bound lytic murein transglycosylase B
VRVTIYIRLLFSVLAVCFCLSSVSAQAAAQDFKSWLKTARAEALERGISPSVVNHALPETMEPIRRVLELDHEQPEGSPDFERYLKNVLSDDRIEKGREKMLAHGKLLDQVENTYGVDKQVIAALWGVETMYGRNTGTYDVVTALATLAYDGRRGPYFRDEMFKALEILDKGQIHLWQMKGSWAGAMGQCQFMPSSWFKFAVDFDHDGRRDIWTSQPDIFASTANYLALSGWKKGEPWGRKVKLPVGFNRTLIGINTENSLQFWHDQGVRLQSGAAVPFEGAYQASIVQPGGAGTQAFIVYDNYRVIMQWNKSTYFATAVGLLSDSLKIGHPAGVQVARRGLKS